MYKSNKYTDNDYEYEYLDIQYEISDINPLIEIKRSDIFTDMQNIFVSTVLKYVSPSVFEHKGRPATHKLDAIFSSWFFIQYGRRYRELDPVIPFSSTKNYYYKQLKNDIHNALLEKNTTDNKVSNKVIHKLKKNLYPFVQNKMEDLRAYLKSPFYTNNKNKLTINKVSYEDYIMLYIENDPYITNNKYNAVLHKDVYAKLLNKAKIYYTDEYKKQTNNADINMLIWCGYYRYFTLKSHNHQLAIPLGLKRCFIDKYKCKIELFASYINHFEGTQQFGCIFYDIEKIFGGRGSVYDITPIRGCYAVNPPYDETVMYSSAKLLISKMKNSNKPIRYIFCIPAWDIQGGIYENNDYKVLSCIEKSGLLVYKKLLPKNKIPYMNFSNMRYTFACDTYFLVVQNEYCDKFNKECFDIPTYK
jgi:hypothetical protein